MCWLRWHLEQPLSRWNLLWIQYNTAWLSTILVIIDKGTRLLNTIFDTFGIWWSLFNFIVLFLSGPHVTCHLNNVRYKNGYLAQRYQDVSSTGCKEITFTSRVRLRRAVRQRNYTIPDTITTQYLVWMNCHSTER